ncbi:zinc-ribbon domain-containing protein [Adlercreutzia faecimuris]|uniref:zinc-ribbon domain-containing protein n=1 Tax=Adlercreutzia faecimuris TaxID=2897341 RepID=UPI003D2FC7A3
MCYQCSGCGRCLGKDTTAPGVTRCPCCRAEVPEGDRRCPKCGAFIRPAPGSLGRRPKPPDA